MLFYFSKIDIVSIRYDIKVYVYKKKFSCFSYIINSIWVCLGKGIRCNTYGQLENKNAEPKFHLSYGLMHKQLASQMGLV